MRVECEVVISDLEGSNGRTVEGIVATCSRCDHWTQSFGIEDKSVKRCLVLLREECPKGETNFYVEQED